MSASAADHALLDILLANGVISEAQHTQLTQKEAVTADEVLSSIAIAQPSESNTTLAEEAQGTRAQAVLLDENVKRAIDDAVTNAVVSESPIIASHGSKGFRFETRDGNFQTNLQWRARCGTATRLAQILGKPPVLKTIAVQALSRAVFV